MFDVVVIGAGVVGGMIARELAKYELKLCIVDKENDVAMGATKANSAIVHAGFDAKEGSMKAKMNVRGSVLMENVARELGVKYRRNGSLVVAFANERAEGDPMNCSLQGFSVHGILQARILEWVAIPFLRGSS